MTRPAVDLSQLGTDLPLFTAACQLAEQLFYADQIVTRTEGQAPRAAWLALGSQKCDYYVLRALADLRREHHRPLKFTWGDLRLVQNAQTAIKEP